jgi:hypothetical protein
VAAVRGLARAAGAVPKRRSDGAIFRSGRDKGGLSHVRWRSAPRRKRRLFSMYYHIWYHSTLLMATPGAGASAAGGSGPPTPSVRSAPARPSQGSDNHRRDYIKLCRIVPMMVRPRSGSGGHFPPSLGARARARAAGCNRLSGAGRPSGRRHRVHGGFPRPPGFAIAVPGLAVVGRG